jgi:hypothetical protein
VKPTGKELLPTAAFPLVVPGPPRAPTLTGNSANPMTNPPVNPQLNPQLSPQGSPRSRMPTIPPGSMTEGSSGAPPPAQAAMASVPPVALPGGPIDASWQRIWLRAQGRDWVSLALIGSSPSFPHATLRVAGMLARISEELGHPLVVLDARGVELRTMASIQARMRSLAARGTRAITVLQLPMYNPITVPIAQAADASMLCVFVGESRLANAQQTIEQVGRDRFLGTVILRHS